MKRKLSTNILKGLKIAEKEGIGLAKGSIVERDSNGCRMCALGLALLPVLGLDKIEEMYYGSSDSLYKYIEKNFKGAEGFNDCLRQKTVSFVWDNNDRGVHPKEIAEKLAECGL